MSDNRLPNKEKLDEYIKAAGYKSSNDMIIKSNLEYRYRLHFYRCMGGKAKASFPFMIMIANLLQVDYKNICEVFYGDLILTNKRAVLMGKEKKKQNGKE